MLSHHDVVMSTGHTCIGAPPPRSACTSPSATGSAAALDQLSQDVMSRMAGQPHQQNQNPHQHRSLAGWQPHMARPCRFGREGAAEGRHQRSASLGCHLSASSVGASSAISSILNSGGCGFFTGAAGSGSNSSGFLQLSGWGGALGSLVAESLAGSRCPSFASLLDAANPLALPAQHNLGGGSLLSGGASRVTSRAPSNAGCPQPTCLICLDTLTPQEFESGEAMYQACACKGDVAARHRHCAVQWSLVKRSTVCDVCRGNIANLPGLPPPEPHFGGGSSRSGGVWDPLPASDPPNASDYLIDLVRVTWVALAVLTLFFNLALSRALAIGGVTGLVLAVTARALVVAQRSAATVRSFAGALRERASAQSREEQQRLQDQGLSQQQWQLPLASAVGGALSNVMGRWSESSTGDRASDDEEGEGDRGAVEDEEAPPVVAPWARPLASPTLSRHAGVALQQEGTAWQLRQRSLPQTSTSGSSHIRASVASNEGRRGGPIAGCGGHDGGVEGVSPRSGPRNGRVPSSTVLLIREDGGEGLAVSR